MSEKKIYIKFNQIDHNNVSNIMAKQARNKEAFSANIAKQHM